MLVPIVAALAVQEVTFSDSKIIDLSLFKNGYAVLMHEATVPQSGVLWLKEPPQAVLGTVWITSDEGTKITEVVATKVQTKVTTKVNADTMVELLQMNVGKSVALEVATGKPERDIVNGTILTVSERLIVVKSVNGTRAFQTGQVVTATLPDATYTKDKESVTSVPAVRIRARAGGKVRMLAMQRGATWSPSYMVQLGDKGKATYLGKATILNDSFELKGLTAKLVTGFPNLRFLGSWDPLTAGLSVDQYLNGVMQAASKSMGQLQNTAFRREAAEPAADFFQPFDPSGEGFSAEDLYFYKQPGIDLRPGDRAYYILFQSETDFEHVYTLGLSPYIVSEDYNARISVPDEEPVWHEIKFKNVAGMPLTTGPATVMQKGEIIGQDELKYTPNGAETFLKISKALDVASDAQEQEVSRERGAIKWENNRPRFDKITITGKIVVTNRKAESIKLKITKDLLGEATAASHGAEIVKTTRGLNSANINCRLTWTQDLKKGERVELTYTYQIYLRSE